MNSQDNDFKLMVKRIAITVVVGLLVGLAWFGTRQDYYDIENPFAGKRKITKTDSIQVMSNDANVSLVIITYHLEVDTDKMLPENKYVYMDNPERYYNVMFGYYVSEALRNNIQKLISFSQNDALRDFQILTNETIKHSLHPEPMSGITWTDYSIVIVHDPLLLSLLERRNYAELSVIEAKAKLERARLEAEAKKLKDPKVEEKMRRFIMMQQAEYKLQDSIAKARKN